MIRNLVLLAGFFFNLAVHAQTIKFDSLLLLQSIDTLQISLPHFTIEDTLPKLKKNPTDSLKNLASKPTAQLNRAEHKLDSLQQSLQTKLDSLTKLPSPDSLTLNVRTRVASQLDSTKSKLSALRSKIKMALKAPEEVGNVTSKVEEVTSKIEAPVANVQTKINEKISTFQRNGASDLTTIPDLPSVPGLPSLGTGSLPHAYQVGGVNLPNGSLPDIKSGNIELPNVDLPSAPMPNLEQTTLPSIDKAGDFGKYSEKISGVTEQVKDYQKEIKGFDTGKLDEIKNTDEWEEKLTELDDFGDVKKQIDLADQAKRYFDPEVAKEEALNKAKQEAINHFAGHEEELKAAMEQLSKLKAKLPDTEGVVDLFAKQHLSLKNKPLIERFTPGLSLQFQSSGSFWLDLNPYIAYQISGRFTSGLGWNERLAYDFDDMQWDPKNHIYGFRNFVHFKFKTNFWFKAEAEIVNAPVRSAPLMSSDIVGRTWVASYFAGIKKDFELSKNLKGNVQMLYNLYNPDKQSPYVNRFNVRMGFELPLKKKKRPESEKQENSDILQSTN